MFVICCFNFADRAVFAVLAQSMKVDLRLTDFQLGLAQGLAFAGLYSLLGIPFGWLSERFNRVRIVAVATTIWAAEAWTWRTAFYALGLPGIISAMFIWLVLREPPRGLVDNVPKSPAPPSPSAS
jgi:MFS family permease